jgi:DNA-binding NtrC family response regulator
MARILNISYDASLLRTREELLKREGLEVVSVVGFSAALEATRKCQYDLAIIGHSIPRDDKRKLAHEMKICDGHIRILSLRRHDTGPIPEADFSLEASEGPAALIDMVKRILASQPTSASSLKTK